MKVTTLIENTLQAGSSLTAQHGLSLYIETEKVNLLFDMGRDHTFIDNAGKLGIDLSLVDIAVISHAHHDHGGGLADFLKLNSKAAVFLSPYVKGEYYFRKSETEVDYIGLRQDILEKYAARMHYITDKTVIAPGVTLMPTTEHSTFIPQRSMILQKKNGVYEIDTFEHELIMVIEEAGLLHVFTGCSHNGVINMALTVNKEFPSKKIQTLTGGFHLMNPRTGKMIEKEETVRSIAPMLGELVVSRIYTGHCTGSEALEILQAALGDKLKPLSTGAVFDTENP